jgi:hypothetical protein
MGKYARVTVITNHRNYERLHTGRWFCVWLPGREPIPVRLGLAKTAPNDAAYNQVGCICQEQNANTDHRALFFAEFFALFA